MYPDLSKASCYGITELLKITSEEDNDESRDSMESRSCLIIDGGWKKLKNLIAEKLVNIANEDKVIIKHARKSLLFDNSEPWMKKDSRLFIVMMGTYDGAEVCELVETFLLHKLSMKYNKNNIALYRDDGLAIFKNISGPKSEN